MTKRVPAEVFPPGEYVRGELEKRGWSQVEFAEILDVSELSVSNLVTGKRAVTPEMAKALEAALGPSAEFWLNLDSYYRLDSLPLNCPGRWPKRSRPWDAIRACGTMNTSVVPCLVEADTARQAYGT